MLVIQRQGKGRSIKGGRPACPYYMQLGGGVAGAKPIV